MDYINGKIYTIRSYQTDDIYIGSTTQTLTKRLSKHKSDFKRWKKGTYHYVTSYELIKYNDVYIELLELCPCSNKMELFRREGELIRSMDCINKNVNGRTDKERKEYIKEYKKEYYQENKEKIKIKSKEYRAVNKDKIYEHTKEYYQENKEKIKEYKKEYYQENKEKIKIQMKEYRAVNKESQIEYRAVNKDKIKEQRNKKVNCECGGKYTHAVKSRHLKSKKHQAYILNVEKLT